MARGTSQHRESELASHDGVRLVYYEEGDGPPVVLLHGFSSSTAGAWGISGIWDRLVAAGMRVIGMDARGHGRSDKPHHHSAYMGDAMVLDVAYLFEILELDRVDLIGYSMGAVTGIHFAERDERVRRLVLGGIGGDPSSWRSPEVVAAREANGLRVAAALAAAKPNEIVNRRLRRMRQVVETRGNDLLALAAVAQTYNVTLGGDFDLARITAPTLVICGDQDVAPNHLAAALPRATSAVVEGGHDGCMVNPAFADTIVSFLTDAPRAVG